MRGTAFDTLEAHANVPPINLIFHKAQFRAAMRICVLPAHHPLNPLARKAAVHFIRTLRSPLHYLFHTTRLKPQHIETISSSCRNPTYRPTMKTIIIGNKEDALRFANTTHSLTKFKVYCDGSSLENGTSAAAILYKGNRVVKSLLLHVGSATEHTVYKTELIGILLALHLLTSITCLLTTSTLVIGLDNQAVIESLNNQKSNQPTTC